MTENIGLQELL